MLRFSVSEDISVVPSIHGWSLFIDGVELHFSDYDSSDSLISDIIVHRFLTITECSIISEYYTISQAA